MQRRSGRELHSGSFHIGGEGTDVLSPISWRIGIGDIRCRHSLALCEPTHMAGCKIEQIQRNISMDRATFVIVLQTCPGLVAVTVALRAPEGALYC